MFLHSFLIGSSKHILLVKCLADSTLAISPSRLLHLLSKKTLRPPLSGSILPPLTSYGFRSVARVAMLARTEGETAEGDGLAELKMGLEREGIDCGSSAEPGKYARMLCPKCGGGEKLEKSFSLFIREDKQLAMWSCFSGKCGWRGRLWASVGDKGHEPKVYQTFHVTDRTVITEAGLPPKTSFNEASKGCNEYSVGVNRIVKVKNYRVLNEEVLQLEPLSVELTAYFSKRLISAETLHRNSVMQRRCNDQIIIAFPYRRNGLLVNCKYRDINKRFWQEKNAERIFYGLDDIDQSSDIIIVEGEIDKLSMEEAGYRNCLSVPDGAPSQVSKKEILNEELDTRYQYLWNCKTFFEKASRIILATDADPPGQALAEELACRLGKERCWRVRWPKKNLVDVCKDANEVLVCLGPDALKKVIENAELYCT